MGVRQCRHSPDPSAEITATNVYKGAENYTVTAAIPDGTVFEGRGEKDQIEGKLGGDPLARFAISLDRLAYAKVNHLISSDLDRTFVRNAGPETLTGQLAADVATLRHGLRAITGRTNILSGRYGQLAVAVRTAGGTLFDFETDELAREVTLRIGAGDAELERRIYERSDSSNSEKGTPTPK